MEIKRKKVSITKSLIKTILSVIFIFLVLLVALLYEMNINKAKFRHLDHVRGIDSFVIFAIFISLFILSLVISPLIILRRTIWNNRHLDVVPISIIEDYIIINDSSNKDKKIYLKDINKFKGNNDKYELDIVLKSGQNITVRYIEEVLEIELYLNSLLDNENDD